LTVYDGSPYQSCQQQQQQQQQEHTEQLAQRREEPTASSLGGFSFHPSGHHRGPWPLPATTASSAPSVSVVSSVPANGQRPAGGFDARPSPPALLHKSLALDVNRLIYDIGDYCLSLCSNSAPLSPSSPSSSFSLASGFPCPPPHATSTTPYPFFSAQQPWPSWPDRPESSLGYGLQNYPPSLGVTVPSPPSLELPSSSSVGSTLDPHPTMPMRASFYAVEDPYFFHQSSPDAQPHQYYHQENCLTPYAQQTQSTANVPSIDAHAEGGTGRFGQGPLLQDRGTPRSAPLFSYGPSQQHHEQSALRNGSVQW